MKLASASSSLLLRAAFSLAAVAGCVVAAIAGGRPDARPSDEPRWWKGNLHTHSLWSDGDDYPEMIADWYKQRGYHFLALSDHNVLAEGQRWIDPAKSRGGADALAKYRARFGETWVESREQEGVAQVRLKPLAEYRTQLEETGRFLMIPSEEVTDSFDKRPVHMNATNIRDLIKPQGGKTMVETMQNNINAVAEQRQRTGQPMFLHMNHPNFGWAVTAEEMMQVKGERFFEVFNGHPQVHNYGDELHAGMDPLWDIILTRRIAELDGEIMYGVAVDDSHHYHARAVNRSNPGRGWVMVRARRLTPEAIVHAMEAGDFYATSGVRLKDVKREGKRLSLEVDAEPGVTYKIQFLGTRKDYDRRSEPVSDPKGQVLTRRYSKDIGAVLAEVDGPAASYELKGDELYVRAKVVSSKKPANPYKEDDTEKAWTQPLMAPRS